MTPYFQNHWVTLYCGDALGILSQLNKVDLCLTEPASWENPLWYELARKISTRMGLITHPAGLKKSVQLVGNDLVDVIAARNLTKSREGALGKTNWIAAVLIGEGFPKGTNSFDFEQLEELPDFPEPKPIECMRGLIGRLCNPDDVVLDPFAGSGTALVAARDLQFHSIGIESSEESCDLIRRRLGWKPSMQ